MELDVGDDPLSVAYLDRLVSLPLSELVREPHLVASESGTVEAELTNLCYREYATFTAVHKCSQAVDSALDDFSSSLDNLLGSVPALEQACHQFTKGTSAVQTTRGRATLVQEHQNKLVELLELPQLMETCVRNGFYQEAMELAAHAATLPANPLVEDVKEEVDQVLQIMRIQLLALLREPVKLPTLVKAVNFLRRLGMEDLGLAFLESRLYNYKQLRFDKTDPVRYVRRYIDHFREHVYDIISQYSAIFETSHLLWTFATLCVDDLVDVVASQIPLITDSASLSSILVQLGYCAQSFSRVGLDFGLLINRPFLDVVEAAYTRGVGIKLQPKAESAETALSAHPTLASFYNQHISALNVLRLLAPVEIKTRLYEIQQDHLAAAAKSLLEYLRQSVAQPASEPSSPRSALLRRNTETQLTPEARAARRRETRRHCLAMARVWMEMAQALVDALTSVYEEKGVYKDAEIQEWIEDNDR